MRMIERPAYWIGTLLSLGVILVTLQLVIDGYLPASALTVSLVGALAGAIATVGFVLMTKPKCDFSAHPHTQSEKAV